MDRIEEGGVWIWEVIQSNHNNKMVRETDKRSKRATAPVHTGNNKEGADRSGLGGISAPLQGGRAYTAIGGGGGAVEGRPDRRGGRRI